MNLDKFHQDHLEETQVYLRENAKLHAKLRGRNRYFRREVNRVIRSQVRSNSSVLDLGCGDGGTLRYLDPAQGFGVDLENSAIPKVSDDDRKYFHIETSSIEEFESEFSFPHPDYIILSGVLEHVYDVRKIFEKVNELASFNTRIVVVTYSRLWQPILRLAEIMRLKSSLPTQNWIPIDELRNLADLVGLDLIKSQRAILIPIYIPLLSNFMNRWIAPLPVIRHLTFTHVSVLRAIDPATPVSSVAVVIAARNEAGNIMEILERIPSLAPEQEVILVEGGSQDNTWEVIEETCKALQGSNYPFRLKWIKQPGIGKGDAVRSGFSIAESDVLIILDADLSVPPEELPNFIEMLRKGKAEFANGSRLVYGMEGGSMRLLNLIGNRFFGSLFTFLLGQRLRDTLCGTKALTRDNYWKIASNRSMFGEFDPFGDFDLLFGAAALNLKIRDQPVHYKARTYGSTNISRFRHGILLVKMSWIAARKIRF